MEALNALGLKPICVLPDQRAKKPPNFSQIPINPSPKIPRNFHGSLVLLASSLSAKFASALTYEEALQQSVTSNSGSDFDFDVGSVFGSIDPLVLAGGAAVIALPLVLSRVFGGKQPKAFGVESAKSAYAKLGDDPNALLLDIRSLKEVREVGSPDVRGLKKKPVSVVYNGEDKPGFLKKLGLKFKEPENTTLYILDKFDGNSELVAELVTANGFKAAYAIKDGAEGPRGWLNSSLPWIVPQKAFSFDLSGLTEAFGGLDGDAGALPVALGLAAAAGVGALALTEMETVLQVLGSAALVQLFSKKLLFAEERKQTLKQLDEFLTTKIAPKDLFSDIKQIGSALLPTVSSRALPAPTEEDAPTNETTATADNALITETVPQSSPPEVAAEPVLEVAAEPVLEVAATPAAEVAAEPAAPEAAINSAPQKEVESKPHFRPLSPYASYPDLKPPTSPTPSQP